MAITNQYVPPIVAGELPGGLTSTARRLPAGSDWTGGVTFESGCGTSGVWSCINDGSLKDVSEKPDPIRFDPFLMYAGQECHGSPIIDELGSRGSAVLVRAQSGLLAQQLVFTDPLIGNPDLTTEATDLTPAAAVALNDGIAGLLSAVQDCGGGEVVLHVPLLATPYFQPVGIEWNGTNWHLGPVVVSVDDYPNMGGLPPADPDNAYIYMTRPVEYELGEIIDVSSYHGRTNHALVMAERMALVRFDPCCAYAINVDLGLS